MGVLALQGAFAAHVEALRKCGAEVRLVRKQEDLNGLQGLVIPGGESTTLSNLLVASGLSEVLKERFQHGFPVFGTCAGMIMLAETILDGRADQISLGALDIDIRRNGYGRQNDSFEQDIIVHSFDTPFHALFIRAPVIEAIGPDVEVLASWGDQPVLVRSANTLASSFHPELVSDLRIHEIFLSIVKNFSVTNPR
ncbi:MAG: pyridoxal 5'-phosphate synthase glutaminase subunit PdxT [Actinobacteria bacterium]|nr:pyridoxal 5'-phosphate synthase glutaminase subunit PdxT [Actinomycetota bacterium]